MADRSSRRTREALFLRNSPLILVLAQVRFSPVLKMGEYVPDIQERMRRSGFPKYSQIHEDTEIRVQGFRDTRRQRSQFWEFANADSTQLLVLGTRQATLLTSTYSTFETFSEAFGLVCAAVQEITGSELLERVGLRYVDLVREEGDHTLRDLLCPEILGISLDKIGARVIGHASQLVCTVDSGTLTVRAMRQSAGDPLPPDLNYRRLRFTKPRKLTNPFVTLDFDIQHSESKEFTSENVIDEAWRLHDHIDGAFRETVTPAALEFWKGGEPR